MTGRDDKLSRTVQLETGMAMTLACTPPRTADVVMLELMNVQPKRPEAAQPRNEG